jgi:hypothetical protein
LLEIRILSLEGVRLSLSFTSTCSQFTKYVHRLRTQKPKHHTMVAATASPVDNSNIERQNEIVMARVRERQWMYLGPIMAAPFAHFAVTLYRDAKTPQQKRLVLLGGVGGFTCLSLGMRLYLMVHAGYPGSSRVGLQGRERVVHTLEEQKQIQEPT